MKRYRVSGVALCHHCAHEIEDPQITEQPK